MADTPDAPPMPDAPGLTEMPEGSDALDAAVAETTPAVPAVDLPRLPIFGKYDVVNITIPDVGLARYINLAPYAGVPHHHGRHANTHFAKMKIPLVERLINHMMRSENYTG